MVAATVSAAEPLVRADGSLVIDEAAPPKWRAGLPLQLAWRSVAPGIEQADLTVHLTRQLWGLRVHLVRIAPRQVRFALTSRTRDSGLRGNWTLRDAPADAIVACNAGQFRGGTPWGWQVLEGRERAEPGAGPLSMAFVVDSAGGARLVSADSIAAVRADGGIALAFQSYPALLRGGQVPRELLTPGFGVDTQHHDSRLALGITRGGHVLLALTRLDGPGPVAGLPTGPTTPQMSTVMGALDCLDSVLLDGGMSGQLRVHGAHGTRAWPGLRAVPLALLVRAR